MRSTSWTVRALLLLVLSSAVVNGIPNHPGTPAGVPDDQEVAKEVNFITAGELKAKISNNEPVTIIDVRSANGLESDNKIKGAFYVKLRRLRYRLGFPPLKDLPKDRDVVTYCACPNDEASVRAAQILRDSGFKRVQVLQGGWVIWRKANGQIEPMLRGT